MCWPFRKKKPPNPAPVAAPPVTGTASSPQVSPSNPVAAARPLQMGVSVFCGWANPRPEFEAVPGVQCPAERPWAALQTQNRVPALGYYNEADPDVEKWRLQKMQEGGIDFACYQIEWAHEHTAPTMMPSYRKKLPSPLLNAHCADNHPADSPVKFCVSLWDVSAGDPLWQEMKANGWTIGEVEASWRWFARTIAARYMSQPNYLTIDGRPVLFRGYAENLEWYERELGLAPGVIDKAVRDEVRLFTGKELYVVATATDESVWPKLKVWGFNALTHYALTSGSWKDAMGAYAHWWGKGLAYAKASGLNYWIPTFAGYDSTAWGSPVKDRCEPTPAEFTAHLREARKLAADNYEITRGMLCSYAWSEFGEGGCIEPMMPGMIHEADEMLKAHRAALT